MTPNEKTSAAWRKARNDSSRASIRTNSALERGRLLIGLHEHQKPTAGNISHINTVPFAKQPTPRLSFQTI
jgi:hypothetical protein